VAIVQHYGDGAQRPKDAADAQRIGNGLAQAVLFGDLKIDHRGRLITTHLDRIHHIVRLAKGRLRILGQIGLHGGLRPERAVDIAHHHLGYVQPIWIDIDQGDLRIA